MATITNSTDVHSKLVTNSDFSWTLGLMAFAIVEDQKFEWIAHFEKTEKRHPTEDEVSQWYRHRTPESFDRAIADAEHALQLIADDALAEIIAEERSTVREGEILQAIRDLNRFWPQFWKNFLGGLVATFVFSILLVVVALLVLRGISPDGLAKKVFDSQQQQQQQEK